MESSTKKLIWIAITVFIAILTTSVFLSNANAQKYFNEVEAVKTEYCKGYIKGYKKGYCYRIINCIEPVDPICPIPEVGFETYNDGHNDGFSDGKADRKDD